MREESYYYGKGNYSDSQKEVRFAAEELVSQAMENGYIVEGVCNLESQVLVLDFIRKKGWLPEANGWLPKAIWEKWYDEILADKKKVAQSEPDGEWKNYHIGISPEFRRSHHFWHWLNSVSHTIQVGGTEDAARQEPYLVTVRSGKASMLEYLMKHTKTELSQIPLDDTKVFQMLSDTRYLEGHPRLPDDPGFDLGVWGYPGIGTKQSSLAIIRTEQLTDFQSLVETTREALAGQSDDRREVPVTEAILEALLGYYYAWYFLHHQNAWLEAYKETYMNPEFSYKQDNPEYDSNLMSEVRQTRYWERGELMLNLDQEELLHAYVDDFKEYLDLSHGNVDAMFRHIPQIWEQERRVGVMSYGEVALEDTYWDFWKWLVDEPQPYHGDKVLTAIACYCADDTVMENKQKLLEAAIEYVPRSNDWYADVRFHRDKPTVGYAQRHREIAWKLEVEKNEWLKEAKAYSRAFTRFSIETESARLFCQSSTKERRSYRRKIPRADWCRAFILYFPDQRERVLQEWYEPGMQAWVLEAMKAFSKSKDFSLSECVEAENRVLEQMTQLKEDEWEEDWYNSMEFANMLGRQVRTDDIGFSFLFSFKNNCPYGIGVRIRWNRDKLMESEDGYMELSGDYKYVSAENYSSKSIDEIKTPSEEQLAQARAFFQKYKVLFAAVWEVKLEHTYVQDYLRGDMSFDKLKWSFEFDDRYFENVQNFQEMEEVVRSRQLFNMND